MSSAGSDKEPAELPVDCCRMADDMWFIDL